MATEAIVTAGPRGTREKPRRRPTPHAGAIAVFVAPFAALFVAFYLVPIGYAIWKSMLVVEREGTFGPAVQVFGGFTQYVAVFENEAFWSSIGWMPAAVKYSVGIGMWTLFLLWLGLAGRQRKAG